MSSQWFSRFFAVAFNGLYFHYTLKWPWIQLVFPFLLKLGFQIIRVTLQKRHYFIFEEYINLLPYFLMCALDFETRRKMKKVKLSCSKTIFYFKLRKSEAIFRAEYLLMIQVTIFQFVWILDENKCDWHQKLSKCQELLLSELLLSSQELLFCSAPNSAFALNVLKGVSVCLRSEWIGYQASL